MKIEVIGPKWFSKNNNQEQNLSKSSVKWPLHAENTWITIGSLMGRDVIQDYLGRGKDFNKIKVWGVTP